MTDNKLYRILNHNKYYDKDALSQEIQRNPQSASSAHNFTHGGCGYALLQAVICKSDVKDVEAIYHSYPPAIKKKFIGQTVLHSALWVGSSPKVIEFLINKWPKATRIRDRLYQKPLYVACKKGASLDVVSLLLNYCPDAIWKKNCNSQLPLHGACSADKVSLEVILLLLEKHPRAVNEKSRNGEMPLDIYRRDHSTSDVVTTVLSHVLTLCSSETLDTSASKEIISYFIEIKWYRGVALCLDHHPYIISRNDFNISSDVLPDVLSMLGQSCKIETMWHAILNRQDVLAQCIN